MTEKIGKYKITKTKSSLKVKYVYGFSDIFGSIYYIIGLSLGVLSTYLSFYNFEIEKIKTYDFWALFIFGAFLTIYFSYLMILGLYNPLNGVLQIDLIKQKVIIRDFLKTEIIDISKIRSMYCKIIDEKNNKSGRQLFGMFTIKKTDGEELECFIIRSSIPIDIGWKVKKDIIITSKNIKKSIFNFIDYQ